MAMGVGLTIAQKLVSKMQGELSLFRRSPRGVAVRVELPAFPLGIPS